MATWLVNCLVEIKDTIIRTNGYGKKIWRNQERRRNKNPKRIGVVNSTSKYIWECL